MSWDLENEIDNEVATTENVVYLQVKNKQV